MSINSELESQRSSVKLMRGTKGDPSWEIKVYDADVNAAMEKALEIDDQMTTRLKNLNY